MNIGELYEKVQVHGFSTDTRTLKKGQVFIALKGETFDANDLAETAISNGATFAVIDNPAKKIDDRYIVVQNTLHTLQHLAALHRQQFSIPILVIGGSNGKTTTKELVSTVLNKKYVVHTTSGNLNNEIGVPLTILQMPTRTEIAVIEIGANHPGEHTTLMNIVSPTHVLITNNGADHLEGFGSLEGVRTANKEIYDWAELHTAYAFVHKDFNDLVEDSANLDRTLYPTKPYSSASSLYAGITYDDVTFTTSLFGSYNEPNILAAITIGEYFDVPLPDIQEAIAAYTPTLKRSQIIKYENYNIVLDCYNANPSSMELALRDFFAKTPSGARYIIIGDMFEMGENEQRVHKEILDLVQTLRTNNDEIWCIGPRFGMYKDMYPFTFFKDSDEARPVFNTLDMNKKTFFLKGSRGIRLENIIKEKILLP